MVATKGHMVIRVSCDTGEVANAMGEWAMMPWHMVPEMGGNRRHMVLRVDDVTCVGRWATRDGALDVVPRGTYGVASFVLGYADFACLRDLFQLGGLSQLIRSVTQASLRPSRIDTFCTTQQPLAPERFPTHHTTRGRAFPNSLK
jgi:hypothetical protein